MMYLILYVKYVINIWTIIWFSCHKIEYPRIRSNYENRDVKMLTGTHILKLCLSMLLNDENKKYYTNKNIILHHGFFEIQT